MRKIKLNKMLKVYIGVFAFGLVLNYVPFGSKYIEPNLKQIFASTPKSQTEEITVESAGDNSKPNDNNDTINNADSDIEKASSSLKENTEVAVAETPASTDEKLATEVESENIRIATETESESVLPEPDKTEAKTNAEVESQEETVSDASEIAKEEETEVPTSSFDTKYCTTETYTSLQASILSELNKKYKVVADDSLNNLALAVANGEDADISGNVDIYESYDFSLTDDDVGNLSKSLVKWLDFDKSDHEAVGIGLRVTKESEYFKAYLVCLAR